MNIKQNILGLIFLGILIVVSINALYFFNQYQKTQKDVEKIKKNPQAVLAEQSNMLIEEVGKLVDLPKGETSTVATVTDISKLKEQPFFTKAKNGDKVLIYTQARKAYLYRPSTNKVIDIAPINIGTNSATTQNFRVALYSGTLRQSNLEIAEQQLKQSIKNIEIVSRQSAKNLNYTNNLVIDLTGKQKQMAESLAKAVNGVIADLPSREVKPDADFLVILGK